MSGAIEISAERGAVVIACVEDADSCPLIGRTALEVDVISDFEILAAVFSPSVDIRRKKFKVCLGADEVGFVLRARAGPGRRLLEVGDCAYLVQGVVRAPLEGHVGIGLDGVFEVSAGDIDLDNDAARRSDGGRDDHRAKGQDAAVGNRGKVVSRDAERPCCGPRSNNLGGSVSAAGSPLLLCLFLLGQGNHPTGCVVPPVRVPYGSLSSRCLFLLQDNHHNGKLFFNPLVIACRRIVIYPSHYCGCDL